jgi:hypothetical protein
MTEKIVIGYADALTNVNENREATLAEIQEITDLQNQARISKEAMLEKQEIELSKKVALFAKLGLSEEEAALLFGAN